MPVVREAHEKAIREWVESVLQAHTPGFLVIFSHPRAQRPLAIGDDYAIVQMLSDIRQATPDIETTDTATGPDTFEQIHCSPRLVTFSVGVFSDNHRALVRELELALYDQALMDVNASKGIAILHPVGGVSDLRTERDTVFENHSTIDFEMTYGTERKTSVNVIESHVLTIN